MSRSATWPMIRLPVARRPGNTSSSLPRSRRLSVVAGGVVSAKRCIRCLVERQPAEALFEIEVALGERVEDSFDGLPLLEGQALQRLTHRRRYRLVVLQRAKLLDAELIASVEQLGHSCQRP